MDRLGYYQHRHDIAIDFGAAGLGCGDVWSDETALELPPGCAALECQRIECSFDVGLVGLETVEFGSYPQTEEGDVLPITWHVIAEQDGMRLLLAECALDCVRYNEAAGDATWQTSDLRAWLNGEFLEAAFSEGERAAIVQVELDNPDNSDFGVPGGDATADNVFCLSLDELGRWFGVSSAKQLGREYPHLIALPTPYAMARGAYSNSKTKGARWWLRSPGDRPAFASTVSPFGSVRSDGYAVEYEGSSVRPALWIGNTGA